MDSMHSTPVTPTSPTLGQTTKELKNFDPNPTDTRSINLEILREQLKAAQIPLTKRPSINELPQSAEDCTFVPGTSRCSLSLCEDSCTLQHRHHRTHQRPIKPDATLVYSRPSISVAGSGAVSTFHSPYDSPAVSLPTSQTNSPQHQYRRASAFGFNFGPRGSVISNSGFFGSGGATPADMASGPPSPLSDGAASATSSAPTSPRHQVQSSASALPTFAPDFTKPIAEEKEPQGMQQQLAPSTSSELVSTNAALDSDFWKLRDRIINLADYRLSAVGKNTPESLSRRDLAPPPREDCPDQEHAEWDPRSPQPPSPIETFSAEVVRVNCPEDGKTVQYELKPRA